MMNDEKSSTASSSFIIHHSSFSEYDMTMKGGLPELKSMRHDAHFVEELTRRSGRHVGSMIPLEMIEPNAEQPRTSLGNIEELAASIREKGVLEPILVRSTGPNHYQVISGERRFRAPLFAG